MTKAFENARIKAKKSEIMTERKYNRYRKSTKYSIEKKKKKDNYTFLNNGFCKKGQVVLAGDSITELFNMELFDKYREESGFYVYSRGISGDTSDRFCERFKDNVLALEPKTVVLLIGVNDLPRKAPPELIANNIRQVLEQIKNEPYSIHTVIEAVYPVNSKIGNVKNLNKNITVLNGFIKKLAKEYGADFLDLTDVLSDENGRLKKEFTYDGLHPNAVGYAAIAERIIPLL